MTVSTARRRPLTRFVTALLTASLAMTVFGAVGTTAVSTYSTGTKMILHNVPPEDLLANTGGVCDGSFDIVIRAVGSLSGAQRYLDAAQRCGLKVVFSFSTTTNGGTVYPARVGAWVRAVKAHPALFGYLSVKEPSWIGISGAEIRALYRAYKAADTTHPVIALFGDIPHFGMANNPYTAGMADIVMVDWYPVETGRGGCSSVGTTFVPYGPKWFANRVHPVVAGKTRGVPIWVMVQTHKYTAPSCHKKQRPTVAQMDRQVHDALRYAGASGIAYQTFKNVNYQSDLRRDAVLMAKLKSITAAVRAGTY